MSEHTKGPWKLGQQRRNNAFEFVIYKEVGPFPGKLASLEFVSSTEAEANARLIAAAPDLLTACKALMDDMSTMIQLVQNGHSLDSFNNDSYIQGVAAIKKTTQ